MELNQSNKLTDSSNEVRHVAKGFLAGLVAGFAGTAVKSLCELISPPRAPGVPSPLGNAINAVSMLLTGHDASDPLKHIEISMHFLFGTLGGAAYGVVAEIFPVITIGYGMVFGASFWLVVHEIGLPLMGLSPSPAKMTIWEQANELISHILFGLALELTRRYIRRRL